MKGTIEVEIPEIDGQLFPIRFDRATGTPLYIRFGLQLLNSQSTIDIDFLKSEIVENIRYQINQTANKTDIEAFVKETYPTSYVQDLQVSRDNSNFSDIIAPNVRTEFFSLDVSRIAITEL